MPGRYCSHCSAVIRGKATAQTWVATRSGSVSHRRGLNPSLMNWE